MARLNKGISTQRWCFGKRMKALFWGRFSVPSVSKPKNGDSKILLAVFVTFKIQLFLALISANLHNIHQSDWSSNGVSTLLMLFKRLQGPSYGAQQITGQRTTMSILWVPSTRGKNPACQPRHSWWIVAGVYRESFERPRRHPFVALPNRNSASL